MHQDGAAGRGRIGGGAVSFGRRPGGRSLLRRRILQAAVVVGVVAVLDAVLVDLVRGPGGGAGQRVALGVVGGIGWVATLGAARRCREDRRRKAWVLISTAIAAQLVVTAAAGPGMGLTRTAPAVFEAALSVLAVMGVFGLADPVVATGRRWVLRLDLATFALGIGALVVLVVCGGSAVRLGGPEVVRALAPPLGDLLVLVAIAATMARAASATSRQPLQALLGAATAQLVAHGLAGYTALHPGTGAGTGVTALGLVASVCLVLAAALETGAPVAPSDAAVAWSRLPRPVMMAPAVAFVLAFLGEHHGGLIAPLVVVAVAATVAVRQRVSHAILADEAARSAALQDQLRHHAFHDPLTGLANRALFEERLEHALARRAAPGTSHSLFVVDLEGVRGVNDTLGYAAGDELLQQVGSRIAAAVRRGDTVARVGGDRFLVLVEDVADEQAATEIARDLLARVEAAVMLGEHLLEPTGSIGIALSDEEGDLRLTELIQRAETAMYAARQAPRAKSRLRVYRSAMRRALADQLALEADLRSARRRGELRVLYQPIVEVATGETTGFEALVRWAHPRRGLLGPEAFVPLAEQAGLIHDLDVWVLREACARAAAWNRARSPHAPLSVHVNLSPTELREPDLCEVVREALVSSGLAPDELVLELVESSVVADVDLASSRLGELRALGARIAADDFGTGYSSLSHLHLLPIDILKIDRSFVASMRASTEASALVHALVQLGRSLGMETVAEGIEDEHQLARLRREGCRYGQGFLFARPLEEAALQGYLHRAGARRAALASEP